eukprot:5852881-Alexandrium_andersonii.AAC.1
MSASLVGSEMCIRDSPIGTSLVTMCSRCARCRPMRPVASRCPSGHGAVSYTHLTLPTICSV